MEEEIDESEDVEGSRKLKQPHDHKNWNITLIKISFIFYILGKTLC